MGEDSGPDLGTEGVTAGPTAVTPPHPGTRPCVDSTPHPTHVWFPVGAFPKPQLICPGVVDLGRWLTGPIKAERKRVNGRDKGLKAERDLANFLLSAGWPDARRSVATGWRTRNRKHQDQGDITGTPGLCFQLKNVADPPDEGAELARWITDVYDQAGPDRLPLLVVKRNGHRHPGDWHLWIRSGVLASLLTGMPVALIPAGFWVRVELGRVLDKLLTYSRAHEQEGTS